MAANRRKRVWSNHPETLTTRTLIREGHTTKEVQSKTGKPRQHVAAVRAHLTMGTYGDK